MKKLLALLSIVVLTMGSMSLHAEDAAEGVDCSGDRVSDVEATVLKPEVEAVEGVEVDED